MSLPVDQYLNIACYQHQYSSREEGEGARLVFLPPPWLGDPESQFGNKFSLSLRFTLHQSWILLNVQFLFRKQKELCEENRQVLKTVLDLLCTLTQLHRKLFSWGQINPITWKRYRKFVLHPIFTKFGHWDDLIISQLQAIFQVFRPIPPSGEFCQVGELNMHLK